MAEQTKEQKIAALKSLISDWENGMPVDQIAAKHGINVLAVPSEMSKLRKAGIPVSKRQPGRHSNLDVPDLDAFTRELRAKLGNPVVDVPVVAEVVAPEVVAPAAPAVTPRKDKTSGND